MRRSEDVAGQIENVGQIEGVVVAMRALAAAHSQEARRHLTAIREQEATVAQAMADALALMPSAGHGPARPTATTGPELRIVVGAAQGFSGLYNERIVEAALEGRRAGAPCQFMLIGQRCITEFEGLDITPVWSANMAAHTAEIPALASRAVDALFEFLGRGGITAVSIVYSDPDGHEQSPVHRRLMPFDFSRIAPVEAESAPLITLAPEMLIAHLVEEYVFTEICEALMLGFASENDARMTAMTRARTNVRRIRDDLKVEFAQLRQEQTTTEIIELSQILR